MIVSIFATNVKYKLEMKQFLEKRKINGKWKMKEGWGGPRDRWGRASLCITACTEQHLLGEKAPASRRRVEQAPKWCLILEFWGNHHSTVQRNYLFEAGKKEMNNV